DCVRELRACRSADRCQVVETAARLVAYATADQLAALRVERHLARAEQETVRHDGVRVRPECRWSAVCCHGMPVMGHPMIIARMERGRSVCQHQADGVAG